MNDTELRQRIRTRFLTGELPMKPPIATWGGRATKRTCAVCDVRIDAVVEIEADSADGRIRFYHLPCYDLVFVERQILRRAPEAV